MIYQFWLPFVLLAAIIFFLDRRFGTLRDLSNANIQPYSWARVQLAWWTVIILSSLIAIVWKDMQTDPPGNLPSLHYSTLVLLGISAATITVARSIDVSDVKSQGGMLNNQPSESFLTDILSDQDGICIHRMQTVIFNALFGIWFIGSVLFNLAPGHNPCAIYAAGTQAAIDCARVPLDYIMPVISDNNLILLGLSSATYAAMKTTENKVPASAPNAPVVVAPAPGAANTNTTISTTTVTTNPAPATNISTAQTQG